jgi:hypothetical protein
LDIEQRIDTCIKTHARASPEYNMSLTFYYKPFFMTWSKDSEFENSGIQITSATVNITGGHP